MPVIMPVQAWANMNARERALHSGNATPLFVDLVNGTNRVDLWIITSTQPTLLLSITQRGLELGPQIDLPSGPKYPRFVAANGDAITNPNRPEPLAVGKDLEKMKGIKL